MSTPQQVSDETQTLPSMGWDDFVQVSISYISIRGSVNDTSVNLQLMEARGFIADTPMIGNSSVRFDPPNPKDPVRLLHAKFLR